MTYHLAGYRLRSIGENSARMADLYLDFTAPVAEQKIPADSLLWLRNGGGKSSLLSLLYAILLPRKVDFMGRVAQRNLTDYIQTGDTAHTVAVWEPIADEPTTLTGGPEHVLITGVVYEWSGLRRPADGDPERLNADYYAFYAVPGVLDAATLPFSDADGPLRRGAYLDRLKQIAAGYAQATDFVTTAKLGQWGEHLLRRNLDPEVFRSQKQMNHVEGAVEDLFKFASAREFINFFLRLTVAPDEATTVSDRLSDIASLLAKKPAKIAEQEFSHAAVTGLERVHEGHADARRATDERDDAARAAEALAASFTATIGQAEEEKTSLGGEREILAPRLTAVNTEVSTAGDLLFLYQERAARMRLAEAEQAVADATNRVEETARAARAWRHTDPLAERARILVALDQVREQAAAEYASDIAPLRVAHDLHAARYRRHLLGLAEDRDAEAGRLSAAAAEAEKVAAGHDNIREEATAAVAQATGQASAAETSLSSLEEELRSAVDDGLLSDEAADPQATLDLLTEEEASAIAAREQVRARRAARPAEHQRLTGAIEEYAARHSDQDNQRGQIVAERDRLTARVSALSTEPRLRQLAEATVEETVDLWSNEEVLLRRLTDAIGATDAALIRHEAGRLDDERVLDAHARTGLLPTSLDADRVRSVLTRENVAAEPGWTFLRSILPADRLLAVLADPDGARLGCGVVVPTEAARTAQDALAVTDTHTTALVGVYTAAQASAIADRLGGTGEDLPTWSGLHPGLVDEDRAAGTAATLTTAKQTHDQQRQAMIAVREADRRLLDSLTTLLRDCPAEHLPHLNTQIDTLDDALAVTTAALEGVKADLARLAAEEEADSAEETRLGEHITALHATIERLAALVEKAAHAAAWRDALAAARATVQREGERARLAAEAATKAGREANALTVRAEAAASAAIEARTAAAAITYLDGEPAEVAPDPDATGDVLRSRHAEALHAYQVRVSTSVLAERERGLNENLAQIDRHIATIPTAEQDQARAYLATPQGGNQASRQAAITAAEIARSTAEADRGRAEGARDAADRALREVQSRRSDRPRRNLPEEPQTAEHAEDLAAEQDRLRAQFQETRTGLENRLRAIGNREEHLTAETNAFGAYVATLTSTLGAPVDAGTAQPYPGTSEQAAADMRRATGLLTAAERHVAEVGRRLTEAVSTVRQVASRYPTITTTARDRLLHDSEQALGANAEHLAHHLRLRAEMIDGELAEIARDQGIVASSLANLVSTTLDTIRKAERYSRLPDSLGAWGGKYMLKIGFEAPANEADLLTYVNRVIDRRIAEGVKPEGLPLLQEAVHEAVGPRGFTIKVLKPTQGLEPTREDITRLGKWSGGERLTVCVALYCTIAALRAVNQGRRARAGGVLILDNPIGRASHGPLVALQRDVAAAHGVQLIYTTGVKDPDAISHFPNVLVMENRPGRTHNRGYIIEVPLDENGERVAQGWLGGVRVSHTDRRRDRAHRGAPTA